MKLRYLWIVLALALANPAKAMTKTEELILAITLNQKLELIKRITSEGAKINKVVNGDSALMAAVASSNDEVAEYLLRQGANPNQKLNSFMTPFTAAITLSNISMVELMLSHGASVNAYSGQFTPILLAAKSCNTELVELLLVNGANPKTKSKSGISGASLAKFNGHKQPQSECDYVQAIFSEFGA